MSICRWYFLAQSGSQEVTILVNELQNFKKGISNAQGAIIIGLQRASLYILTTATNNEDIQKFEFTPEKDQPGNFLNFLLGIYGFNAEIDKKTTQNKVLFSNDGKARIALKEFFNSFKSLNDQKPVVVIIQRCDVYIKAFPEFFDIIVQLIKDTKTKKIPIYIIVHFESEPDYKLLPKDIKKLPSITIPENFVLPQVTKKQKSSSVHEESKKPAITHSKPTVSRQLPPVFHQNPQETKKIQKIVSNYKFDSKVLVFSDHQLGPQATQKLESETVNKLLSALQVTLNNLYDNQMKGQVPSYMLLRTLDELSDNLSLNSDKKRVQALIELAKQIYSKYMETTYYFGATEIARFIDKLFFIIGDKNNRAEFTKGVGISFQALGKLNIATEFLTYAILSSKEKELPIQLAEIYEKMGDEENKSQPYLARTYYFKALSALKLVNDPSITRISEKACKTYKSDDVGANYFLENVAS